jgi:hypothetical protein
MNLVLLVNTQLISYFLGIYHVHNVFYSGNGIQVCIKQFQFFILIWKIVKTKNKSKIYARNTQHLHVKLIFLIWYDIPELVIHIMISLIDGCCLQKKLLNQWISGSHHSESFTVVTKTWLIVTEYIRHKWHGYVPLVVVAIRTSFMTYQRVSKYKQDGASSGAGTFYTYAAPGFTLIRSCVVQSLVFCVVLWRSLLFFCSFSSGHCFVRHSLITHC